MHSSRPRSRCGWSNRIRPTRVYDSGRAIDRCRCRRCSSAWACSVARTSIYEVLIGTRAVSAMIREGKTHQIPSAMQTGRNLGMQTLNEHMVELVSSDVVEPAEAYLRAHDKTGLLEAFRRTGIDFTPK
jgi:type II secretory ATPase GspE/PulE/Tfp pilus assembly ATPase PilB-like protein